MKRTSSPTELLVTLDRDRPRSLASQIEDQIRRGIQQAVVVSGTRMPSSRDLASELGVSRGVVVNAYAQLASEGYLIVRKGSRPVVSAAAAASAPAAEADPPRQRARFDFRVGAPDVSLFPRAAWLRSLRAALQEISSSDLGYGDERGVLRLRSALAAYLGRVRRVVAEPQRIVVTSGHLQGHGI